MTSITAPLTARLNAHGHYEIGGCDTLELTQEFGTPLYVIDEQTVRQRCRQYLDSFRAHYPNTEVCFASKALCTIGLSKLIASEGLGFDVSSGGELYTVLKAGADPKKIYFHGNNKTPKEIEEGLHAGIGRFVIDNEAELKNLAHAVKKTGLQAHVIIRVNPGIEAHTHEFIQTGKIDSKFGVPLDQLDDFIKHVRSHAGIKLEGLHAHIGSQIFDVKPFIEEAKLLLGLVKKYKLAEINLGGGLGIAYLKQHEPPAIEHFAKEIAKVLKGQTDAKLVLEPGRSIVGTAGVTLYTVGAIKKIPGIRTYAIVDGGMSDNPRPILYDAKYEALIVDRSDENSAETVTIAGRFCESGDVLVRDVKLPPLKVGDTLLITATGAYTYSMASNYNRVPRPAMVLVNNGRAAQLVQRESYEDLVRNDAA
jgi:diaminopimelate decarboxylase